MGPAAAERATCDVLVVGGGAAGTAAAHLLTRARRSVLLVDDGRPPAGAGRVPVTGVPWMLPQPSDVLRATIRRELKTLGPGSTRVVDGSVASLTIEQGGRVAATLDDGRNIGARAAILATGVEHVVPDVDGLRELWGSHVFTCPYCHGPELMGRRIGVLADGADGAVFALHMSRWTAPGTPLQLFLTGADTVPPAIRDRVRGSGTVVHVGAVRSARRVDGAVTMVAGDGRAIVVDAVFIRADVQPRSTLARALGCRLDDGGFVVVDGGHRSARAPIYAAGEVATRPGSAPDSQLVQAAADGVGAALACDQDMFFMQARLRG